MPSSAFTLQRQRGYVEWRSPVVLMAHLDAPLSGGLAVEGNLRVEGWAFWIDGEGRVQQPQLTLRSEGRNLPSKPLAVPRPDVNAAHGLGEDTPPLGFRFLLQPPWPEDAIAVQVEMELGQSTLARLQRQPADAPMDAWLSERLQQGRDLRLPPREGPQASWEPLLNSLREGPAWDGSTVAEPKVLRQRLEHDLDLIRTMLERGQGSDHSGAVLTLLAQRYGLPLLEQLMEGVNQRWLAAQHLEFTRHGVQRTFRYWSAAEKAEAMAISTGALLRWQAEGISCFHTFGTLLGLVRERDLLAYDDDIDAVAVVPVAEGETPEQAVAALELRLRQLGHDTLGDYRFHRHVLHCGIWFDLFVATLQGEELTFWGTKIWSTELARVLPTREAVVGGLLCVLPFEPEHVVEGIYGGSWRSPSPYHYTGIAKALGSGSHDAERIKELEEQPL
ncbi:MAG: hypothetical protein NTV57_16190 [Cyanobacteria bacterium]|nr:hypothetical protein [Cyanobacteriota bacterium]